MKEFAPAPTSEMGIETIPVLTRNDYAQLPLSGIVAAPMDRSRPAPDILNTAGHELNHGIAALGQGVPIKEVSVIPEGFSLGHTTVAGIVSPEQMKIIAAAGAVNPADGSPARGYGSDMVNIKIIDYLTGFRGMSADQARLSAGSIISGMYSRQVRERAAHILVSLGKIDGSLLPLILARAKAELELERTKMFTPVDEDLLMMLTAHDPYPDSETILTNYGNDVYGIQYVVAGEKSDELIFCKVCGGESIHQSFCPAIKNSTGLNRSILTTLPNAKFGTIKPMVLNGKIDFANGKFGANEISDIHPDQIQSGSTAGSSNTHELSEAAGFDSGKNYLEGDKKEKGTIYSFNKPEDGLGRATVFPKPFISGYKKYQSVIQ